MIELSDLHRGSELPQNPSVRSSAALGECGLKETSHCSKYNMLHQKRKHELVLAGSPGPLSRFILMNIWLSQAFTQLYCLGLRCI